MRTDEGGSEPAGVEACRDQGVPAGWWRDYSAEVSRDSRACLSNRSGSGHEEQSRHQSHNQALGHLRGVPSSARVSQVSKQKGDRTFREEAEDIGDGLGVRRMGVK